MANEQMGMPAAAPSPDEMAVFDIIIKINGVNMKSKERQ